MDASKQIIAIASRYGVVVQHTFPDLYCAIIFLKKGARNGKHLALGAFNPSNGVVYTLDEGDVDTSPKVPDKGLTNFIELGIKVSKIVIY